MSNLRLRLRFNPGRDGMPLDKVGEIAVQAEKFLRAFADGLGVDAKKGEWLAKRFENESVSYDAEFAHAVDSSVTDAGREVLALLTGDDPIAACSRGLIEYDVLSEFSKIGKSMDPDEVFYIGTYESDTAARPTWHPVKYRTTEDIRRFLETPFITYGSVQGIMHNWAFGASPPFFHLREVTTGDLVKCVCSVEQYRAIHEVTTEPNSLLNVYGDIQWDRGDDTMVQITVERVEGIQLLSPEDFDKLFGSMPDATGQLSTSEFIAKLRGDDV